MCDTGAQEVLPNFRVVNGPQGDLTTNEVCNCRREGMKSAYLCGKREGDRPGKGPACSMEHWENPMRSDDLT